jgi:hypothetical protein
MALAITLDFQQVKHKLAELRKAKRSVSKTCNVFVRRLRERETHDNDVACLKSEIEREWPRVMSQDSKDRCISNFLMATSSNHLKEGVCATCGEQKLLEMMNSEPVPISDLDMSLLRSPDRLWYMPPVLEHCKPCLRELSLDKNRIEHEMKDGSNKEKSPENHTDDDNESKGIEKLSLSDEGFKEWDDLSNKQLSD